MSRVAADFHMPCTTEDEQMTLFAAVAEMESWRNKSTCPKTSRWFSWIEASHQQLREFWASRMVLEKYLESTDDLVEPEDAHVHIGKTKVHGSGGLKLVYKCMKEGVWRDASILSHVGKVLWTFFSDHVSCVKSAEDQLAWCGQMVTDWPRGQLTQLAQVLSSDGILDIFNRSDDEQSLSCKLWKYVITLMGNRAASMSKYGAPPHCYAKLLTESSFIRQRPTLMMMKRDWKGLVALELSHVDDGGLVKDLRIAIDCPTRLMMQCFEVVNWDTMSNAADPVDLSCAYEILMRILKKPPDSKTIEDLHQRLRVKNKKKAHERLTPSCAQLIVNSSDVISLRGIHHPAHMTRENFLQHYRSSCGSSFDHRRLMHSKKHHMPKWFGKILRSQRDWTAITDESLNRSCAAWAWLRLYNENHMHRNGVKLSEPFFKFNVL